MKYLLRLTALLTSLLLLTSCAASAHTVQLLAAPSASEVSEPAAAPVDADLASFVTATAPQILSGGGNRVYSPVSLYAALSTLTATTAGNTQAELLTLLGCPDLPTLQARADSLWQLQRNDGMVTRTFANSLWLSDAIAFREETVADAAQDFHASVYRGRPGSDEMDAALQSWLNSNTLGLLQEQISSVTLPPSTAMAIASTVAFSARWASEFIPENNETLPFRTPAGEQPCTFLCASRRMPVFTGERFRAIQLSFDQRGGAMWIILPDEGVTPQELLADADCLALLSTGTMSGGASMLVHLKVPKFDVSSQLELSGALQALGLTDAFDPAAADFSPLTDSASIALSQVRHDARVVIDEEGCEAAAYTVMILAEASAPQQLQETDFIVDRPFLFSITTPEGLALFVGVVEEP